MLSRIFVESLVSVSSKHNYKTTSKDPPASSLHCIESILSHSSGKYCDSLTMAVLTFMKSTGICTMITIPLLVVHLVHAFGTAKGFFNLIIK